MLAVPLQAAELEPNMDLLVFDPVPITLDAPAPSAGTSATPYHATELLQLPRDQPKSVLEVLQGKSAGTDEAETTPPDITLMEARLKQQESKGNSYDKAQAESMMELAGAYERLGDYDKALPLYERANHIIRINEGLYSLTQEPLLQRMIGNHIARGDIAAADQAQHYLFYIRSKVYGRDSLDLVPALQDLAQWNVTAYRMESLSGPVVASTITSDKPRQAIQQKNSYYDQMVARLEHLRIAHEINSSLVQLLQSKGDQRLPHAEYQLASTNFLYTRMLTTINPMLGDSFGDATFNWGMQEYRSSFSDGRKALERRLKLLSSTPGVSLEDQTKARLDLMDWMIATDNRSDLRELAEAAYQQYLAAAGSAEEANKFFEPLLPVAVPTFVIFANTRSSLGIPDTTALQYRGHIDVEFDLSALGDTTNVAVLDKSPDTPARVTETLLRTLRRGQFRPHLHEGKVAAHKDIRVRYYYTW